MDKMVLLRSMHHDTGDHFAGAHCMLTGRFGSNSVNLTPRYPSMGSYAARVLGPNRPGLPAYVGLPSAQSVYLFPGYQGAAYLGAAYHPFEVDREAPLPGRQLADSHRRPEHDAKSGSGAGRADAGADEPAAGFRHDPPRRRSVRHGRGPGPLSAASDRHDPWGQGQGSLRHRPGAGPPGRALRPGAVGPLHADGPAAGGSRRHLRHRRHAPLGRSFQHQGRAWLQAAARRPGRHGACSKT